MKKPYLLMSILILISMNTYGTIGSFLGFKIEENNDNIPYLVKEFYLEGTESGKLLVKTSGGSINVVGSPGNKVRVEMFVRPLKEKKDKNAKKHMEKVLSNYDVSFEHDKSIISIIAEPKGWWLSKSSLSISFTVYVPYEFSSDLTTNSGSIHIFDLKGFQKMTTSGGSIHCHTVDGDVKAITSGGSIHIENYEGELDASTSGGSIKLKNANGNLKIQTSGGGISLHDVSGKIDAGSSGGGITADVKHLVASMSLRTIGGSIYAIVPAGQGLDLDLKGTKVYTELVNFDGKSQRDKIIGSINGGGIPIILFTSSGTVNLNFRN